MPLTPQQSAALDAGDLSVSLAAGAGCGKTFVLTERFLSYLDPESAALAAEFDELIAITFTDAAAREMRERIRRRCRERLAAATTPEHAAAWRRLLRGMDAAQISTIHAFCGRLLRRYAVEAGIDPQFQVLDAAAADLLRVEAVDDGLRELLESRDETAVDLAARRGLATLRNELVHLLRQTHRGDVERWLAASADVLVDNWRRQFDEIAGPAAVGELAESPALAALAPLADPALAASDRLRAQLGELARVMKRLDGGVADATAARALFSELDGWARLKGGAIQHTVAVKDWIDPGDHALFRTAAENVRDAIKQSILGVPFDEEASRDAARTAANLVQLAATLYDRLELLKRTRNQLEFDDLLAGAHRLLTGDDHPQIRRDLADKTRLLMVDEFQDTDPMQVEIVQALCSDWRDSGLFVVGDDKQSIYRFRGAEPEVSRTVRQELASDQQLSLTTNFRSQPAILDFVNATFCDSLPNYEPLTAHRTQVSPEPAIEFLWAPAKDDSDGLGAALAAAGRPLTGRELAMRREARWIARRIAALIDSGEPLIPESDGGAGGGLRPVRLGDFAILLRTLSALPIYEEALREQGLDYYLAGGHAFYAQQEVFDVLNLLRSVVALADEISLLGCLRSPLFGIGDESFYWLVQLHGSLNAALVTAVRGRVPRELSAAEAAKVCRAATTIEHLRGAKDRLLVAELLDEAVRRTGYDAVLQAEFLGQRKLANLEKLREQARALDAVSPGDVAGFVTQLAEFVARAPKEPPAATQAEGNVVRIMTIHHAKGLEFPVVVLPDLDRQERDGDSLPAVHRTLGPLVPGEDKKPSLGWRLYRALEKRADREERRRLFYVATTRAADRLILSSSIADFAKPHSEALRLLGSRFDLESGRFRGGELPARLRPPRVDVVLDEPVRGRREAEAEHGADLAATLADCAARIEQGRQTTDLPRGVRQIAADRAARRRFSFSQLSGALETQEGEASSSSADDDEQPAVDSPASPPPGVSRANDEHGRGRQFGTLVHEILRRIDFGDATSVERWAELLAPLYFADDAAEIQAAAARQIRRFLASPRGAALAAASQVRREVEFLLPWPPDAAGKLPRDGSSGRYIHGYLDCLYADAEGRWRLVDYKTNQVATARVPEAAAAYELQLFVYTLACEQSLGVALAEATLVFLEPGAEVSRAWSPAERERAVARVTAGMDALSAHNVHPREPAKS